jgi:quinoprotein glucose dehydrogenase
MMKMPRRLLPILFAVAFAGCHRGRQPVPALADAQTQPGEWPSYHRDLAGTRYSPLDQINKDNVSRLAIAWTWLPDTSDAEYKSENTPIMIGGVLYFTSGAHRAVIAVDAATGAQKWKWRFDESPRRFRISPRPGAGRGVSYWTDGSDARIFVVTPGFQLVALDAKTGAPVRSFGTDGFVDLKLQLGVPAHPDTAAIGASSPPLVFENTVVIGPALEVGLRPRSFRNVPGRILAIDAKTGALKWRFNTIPTKGEFGYETWENGSAEYSGNTGAWAPLSLDTRRGYLYLPIEAATGDYYGGHRLGDNLFSTSLVCLDIRTGKRVWHYQIIHHDIWDRDNPTAPILADITVDGRRIESVIQMTKQSYAYVFDRVTGKPVWPIVETPVPQSDVPGERTAATQPIPSRPAGYDRQQVRKDDLVDFTPALRAAADSIVRQYRLGELFSPPSLLNAPDRTRGTLSLPGTVGGGNWEHGAFDPETGILYAGSFTNVAALALERDSLRSDMNYVVRATVPTVRGIPLFKPPYSRITAIDMNKGEHVWMVPNGDTPDNIKNNAALQGVTIPTTGATSRPVIMATKTLIFNGEGWGSKPILHVLDKKTGARVVDIPVPGQISSNPMTYMAGGRQYVAFWVGRPGSMPAQLIALTLDGASAPR